jgi:N-methylhydantoinase A
MEGLTLDLGGDVGETFTTVWVAASDGRAASARVPSGDDPGAALVAAIERAADSFELTPPDLFAATGRVAVAIDLARPALEQGTLARTALLTTAGFGDTLELGRAQRGGAGVAVGEPAARAVRARPLVPRALVVEVPERVTRTGAVLAPLDEDAATQALKALAEADVEAVAVCTLWSTANPDHELRLRELVADILPDAAVVLSHEVAPVVGEHARMTATVAGAAAAQAAGAVAERVVAALSRAGVRAPVLLGTGLGGAAPVASVAARPLDTAMARPAAALAAVAAQGYEDDLLVLDAGGSSVQAGVLLLPRAEAGEERERPAAEVPLRRRYQVAGLELGGPVLDARTLAGGGASVAGVRAGGLEVGLRGPGAGSRPACFRRARGQAPEPTVTDADLLLGTLDPARFERAGLRLDRDAAERAMTRRVAAPLGLDVTAAAWAVRAVFAARVAEAAALVAADHGRDPAELTLVVAGGLGPSHGWLWCRALGLDEFVVPAAAAGLTAMGVAGAGRKVVVEQALHVRVVPDAGPQDDQLDWVRTAVAAAAARATAAVRAMDERRADDQPAPATKRLRKAIRQAITGAPGPGVRLERFLRVRYEGQAREVTVPLAGISLEDDGLEPIRARFEQVHAATFGPGAEDLAARPQRSPQSLAAAVEIVGVLAVASGPGPEPPKEQEGEGQPQGEPGRDLFERTGRRPVVFDDPARPVDTAVWSAERPAPGQTLAGPCLIELPGCCVVVPPGADAVTDETGDLLVSLAAAAERVARLADLGEDEDEVTAERTGPGPGGVE